MFNNISLLEKVAATLRADLSAPYEVVVSRGKFPTSRPHLDIYKQGVLFRRKIAEVYPEYDSTRLWVDFEDPVEVIMEVAKTMSSKGS